MYKKIIVPLDGSELAECVLPHVNSFITGCQVDTIVFVRVIEFSPVPIRGSTINSQQDMERLTASSKRIDEERKSSAEEYLKQMVSQLKQDGVKFQTEVLIGKVAEKLVDYTEANDVDLILIATHGRSGVSRWVRGSIADRILRASKIPVLMVRAPGTSAGH
jgi:nucleotide-binding universal stress UspA family protein